ncbi:MAG: MBL fold metallo-hydrolase [Nitrososphaerota archaeon]
MKLTFLGGAKEVGRSAILLDIDNKKILLDYGVMLNNEPSFPAYVPAKDIDLIALSHAHLDHSGAIPLFFTYGKTKLVSTSLTFETSRILFQDFIKLSGYYLPYEYLEVHHMLREGRKIYYEETFSYKDLDLIFIEAGHIPGSGQIIISNNKRILYTGDFSTIESRLLKGAKIESKDLDAVIIEATYANEDHENRKELEKRFIQEITEIVEEKGKVLIPAFSVGRAQEILCILAAYNFNYPIALDGMAIKVLEMYLRNKEYIKDYHLLKKAANKVDIVTGKKKRRKVLERPGVIISPAGMLKGGPAAFYAEKIAENKRDAIFLVSFQIKNTPGAILLEEGKYLINGKEKKVKAKVKQFKFSSHCGRKELHEFLKKLDTKTKVFIVHGEKENCLILEKYARSNLSLEAYAVDRGGSFYI